MSSTDVNEAYKSACDIHLRTVMRKLDKSFKTVKELQAEVGPLYFKAQDALTSLKNEIDDARKSVQFVIDNKD